MAPSDNLTTPRFQPGTARDRDAICRTLADAFARDPVMSWFQPREDLIPRYFEDALRSLYLPRGRVWMSDCGQSASLWLPPGVKARDPSLRYMLHWASRVCRDPGPGHIWRAWREKQRFSGRRPLDAWYLHALGVHQSRRGTGLGGALMAHCLDQIAPSGRSVWLENSNEQNLPFYRRFGFEVVDTLQLNPDGPPLWLMLRTP